eukprot:CAMPEP_0176375958 /NCGR_PEP_ID=MMETSP0126-20121128/27855_1 /TAXON_ID=141414 ORGANISM="Strombidinopsis acuminatum, Strain SPMC142" /NCGR_SAMPLE_ID=MMETSP0126 /ASSEMBLY_ACC=CAM_ASM_000229 /LENGTH=87 /DNA_ID=CAMNT_0017737209 /DNA_START=362 /DNA_END=625 /DNA_ORIENTATION=+
MDADSFAANFTNCGDMYLEFNYVQWPVYNIKKNYADFGNYYFNTTMIAMNASNTAFYCTDTVQNFNQYRLYEQKRFGTKSAYLTSML